MSSEMTSETAKNYLDTPKDIDKTFENLYSHPDTEITDEQQKQKSKELDTEYPANVEKTQSMTKPESKNDAINLEITETSTSEERLEISFQKIKTTTIKKSEIPSMKNKDCCVKISAEQNNKPCGNCENLAPILENCTEKDKTYCDTNNRSMGKSDSVRVEVDIDNVLHSKTPNKTELAVVKNGISTTIVAQPLVAKKSLVTDWIFRSLMVFLLGLISCVGLGVFIIYMIKDS